MNCFIHLSEISNAYCKICRRPICEKCYGDAGICPRCLNFQHSTLLRYNRQILKLVIPLIIIRIIIYWDTMAVYFLSNIDYMSMFPTGIVLLTLSTIPFVFSVIKNGFANAIKYQVIGKTDPILIADNKTDVSFINIVVAILVVIITFIGFLIVIPLFIITDIIHLFVALKQVFYHKKEFNKIKNI